VRKFTEEELDSMSIVDLIKARDELHEEINKSGNELYEEFLTVTEFSEFKKLFAKSQKIHFYEKMEDGFGKLIEQSRLENIEKQHNKLVAVIRNEFEKNKEFSDESRKKLKELEEEIKKNSKSRSIIGDVSLSLFKSDITGFGMEG